MAAKRNLNVFEALEYLEKLEVPSDDSEHENEFVLNGNLVILPPQNIEGRETDEDSAEENEIDPNRLNKYQLLASAQVELNTTVGNDSLEDMNDQDIEMANTSTEDKLHEPDDYGYHKKVKRLKKMPKKCMIAEWRRADSNSKEQLNKWNESAPSFEMNMSPHELFELFLTNYEMERICFESTNYARLKGDQNFTMTLEKFKAFLAVLLVSGYAELPRQGMYWERREDGHNLLVSAMMTENEFEECKKYLHFNDNSYIDETDRFAKVRPLLDSINRQCLLNYQPTQNVSIDRSIVPYFGRHGMKQYIHGKPVKFGYKLWVMATPLGYCIQFHPYAGKDTTLQGYADIGLGLGASVVAHLVNGLPEVLDSNYHIVMDNFFTSPELLRYLKSKGIAATGTVKVSRMENAPLKDISEISNEERGSSDVVTDVCCNITAVRWKDNKVVNAMSTFTGKEPIQEVKRFCQKQKKHIGIEQPNIISVYNKSVGGVDRMNHNIATYMINLRSKKWWWPLFRFVVDVAVNNAFQLYRLRNADLREQKLDALGFRREIVDAYFRLFRKGVPNTTLYPGNRILHYPAQNLRYDNLNHWIVKGGQRRCALPGCRGTSKYSCEKCNVGLHPDCFKIYHSAFEDAK